MKKIFLLLLICLTVGLTGCARGVITLDISRMGAADIDCKLVAVPVLAKGLDSFRSDFSKDGYAVSDVADGDMKNKRDLILSAILLIVLFCVSWFVNGELDSYIRRIVNLCLIYAIIGLSMNVTNGFTGQFSLGQAGFMRWS